MAIQYVDANCDVVGTVAGTFNITGSNDQVQLTIDGGSVQNFTLTHGAARTAAQVAADINATITGGTAYAPTYGAQSGHVRIRTTSSLGASSTILVGAPSNHANTLLGFTATTYSGAPRAHTSWTQITGTKQELINKIETELLAVGWTTISGSGTTTLVMQSALSPPGQDLQMRLRVKDNSGNCVTLSIENVAGSPASTNSTTAGAMLLPAAAKQWLFTVNKYQGVIRSVITTASRGFAAFGVPMVPTFLQGVVTEAIWGQGNATSDTDATTRLSMRTSLTSAATGVAASGNCAGISNGSLLQQNNTTTTGFPGCVMPSSPGSVNGNAASGYQWRDNSGMIFDALIGWGLATPASDVVKWCGHLWDAAISSEAFTGDLTTAFDSHNWIILTDNGAGSSVAMRGTVLLVTP